MSRGTSHAGDDPHADEPLVTGGTSLETANSAVVLVHGRGATARSILGFGREIASDGTALLAPQAAGNTWYPNSFLSPVSENEPGRSSGIRAVENAVSTAVDAGIRIDDVVVAGFSQGACLASEFVARTPREYGGIAALSGGLIGETIVVADYLEGATERDPLAGTPVFLGCSDVDPHIPEERVHETADVLGALGGDVETRIYDGMGHGINEDETAYVSSMIAGLS